MDLFDVVRACFRRWYLVLPLLLVTSWFCYDIYSSAKPVYYSQTVLGIAPANFRVDQAEPGQPVPRNALLDVGGATLMASLASFGLQEQDVKDRVVAAGGLPDYYARPFPTPPPSAQLPLVMIEVSSPDPAKVTTTLEGVSAQAEVTLRTIQALAGVPADLMVKPFIVSPPTTPAGAMPTRTRSTIAIFVAGTGITVLLAVAVDVLLTRRKSRVLARTQTVATAAAAGRDPVVPPPEVVQTNGGAVDPVADGTLGAK